MCRRPSEERMESMVLLEELYGFIQNRGKCGGLGTIYGFVMSVLPSMMRVIWWFSGEPNGSFLDLGSFQIETPVVTKLAHGTLFSK